MRHRILQGLLSAAAAIGGQAAAQTTPPPPAEATLPRAVVSVPAGPLTLESATRIAQEANPSLRAAFASRAAAEGQLTDSRALLWNNPTLYYEQFRRTAPQPNAPDQRFREWGLGVSQAFEIAGQQGLRRDAAREDLAALDASVMDLRLRLRSEVEEQFVKVLALQQRIAIERENLKLVDDAAGAVRKRVVGGETSKLDGNLAAIEAERTRNQLATLSEQLVTARAAFAQLLQLPSSDLPEVTGSLSRPSRYDRDELIARVAQRPQIEALTRRESAARSRLELERASVYPDVTLGLATLREGPSDLREQAVGLTFSVPIPIFRRNATGIGRATTELTHTQIERQATERDIRAEVNAQWMRYEQLQARVARLRLSVVPTLEDNLRLSHLAFRAGEIGIVELLLVNRQVLDGRRDVLEAETELRLSQIALERAAGWSSTN